MLVSFIIPFYGSVPFLKRTLDSLVAQTDGDFEVVVVDDRSPEAAGDLVARYDGRFRYVLQPENRGPYQGRVRGVEEARGDYVVDVDCDDYVLPELMSELRAAIERHHADIVIYNVEQDAEGVITPHWCRYETGVYSPAEVMERLVDRRLQWNFWAKAIRREMILKTWETAPGLHATRVLAPDDFCATVPMILESEKIEVIPYVGHRYWQGAQSICRGMALSKVCKALRDTREARRLVLDFAERKGCSAALREQIKDISRMISSWWLSEYVHDVKRRLMPRGKAHGFSLAVGLAVLAEIFGGMAEASQIAEMTLPSKLLHRDVPVTVVLPDAYAVGSNRYPVAYLLHGYGGSNRTFILGDYRFVVCQAADEHKMILVMPDGDSDRCWIDSPVIDRSWYESFVQAELVQFVDRRYRTKADRTGRAIIGVSMGGFGAWWIGLRHPQVFGSIGSVLGCVDLADSPEPQSVRRLLGDAGVFADRWREHSILKVAESLENGKFDLVSINATEDLFLAGNRRLHLMLSSRGVRHTYMELRGEDDEHSGHTAAFGAMALRMMFFGTNRFFITGNRMH